MATWGHSGVGQTPDSAARDDDDIFLIHTADSSPRRTQQGFCFRYSSLLARYPLPIFIALILITVACGLTVCLVYDLPGFEDPTKGFEARGIEITKRRNTWYHLRTDNRLNSRPLVPVPGDGGPVGYSYTSWSSSDSEVKPDEETTGDQNKTFTPKRRSRRETIDNKHRFCSSDEFVNTDRMVFTPVKGDTLFTTEAMMSMCNLQKTILNTFATAEDRQDIKEPYNEMAQCENTWSILNIITNFSNKTSCDDITEDDLNDLSHLLKECAFYYEIGLLSKSCELSNCQLKVPDKCLANDVVETIFHFMTPNSFVNEVKQRTLKLKSAMMYLDIYHWDDRWDFYMDVFEKKTVSDGITAVSAMKLFIKFDLFDNYLESDALYLALGTGLAILIIVLYTGSVFITIMTIINMGMSLIVAYFTYRVIFQLSFVPFVNILAVVLLIGIGADDTFVFMDIWNKAKADLPNKDRATILHETLRHAAVTMFVTSFTTGSALYTNIISSITAIKCFAVFSGTAIMANFVFTITWLPVVVVMDDWCNERCCGWRQKFSKVIKSVLTPLCKVSDKLFTIYLPVFVFNLRYLWIAVFTILGIGGAYIVFVSPKLKLPTQTDFQIFYSDHPLEKYDQVYKKQYDFEQDQVDLLPYIVVFGAVPKDDRSTWDPDSKSSTNVTLLENFDVNEPKSQEWLLNFCSDMKKVSFVSKHHESHCFIEVVKSHMQRPCSDDGPYSLIPDTCCNRTDFPYPKSDFQICAPIVCEMLEGCSGFGEGPFYIPYGPLYSGSNSTIVALSVIATSTYKDGPDYDEMHEFWTAANSWTTNQMTEAPPGMRGGWFITRGWYQTGFYALQSGLATGAAESMGISLLIAALVLFLTTRNGLISLYAIFSVSGTVFVTIASLVLLGWQLNIVECVILSIAVGLSVDFTIHYGVAYRIAPVPDRKGRSEFALKTLGSAITVAALSTFSAGAMMMPASVLSYSQLGIFMMLVMSISWAYANFFFLSLCRILGPSRNIGQIPLPKCTRCNDNNPTLNSIDNNYMQDRPVEDAIYSPCSDNLLEQVEMDAPGTMQFNSLVVGL